MYELVTSTLNSGESSSGKRAQSLLRVLALVTPTLKTHSPFASLRARRRSKELRSIREMRDFNKFGKLTGVEKKKRAQSLLRVPVLKTATL